MSGPRVFLGCASYRWLEAATAASREECLLNPPVNCEIAGAWIPRGYSACQNIEKMMERALAVCGPDGLLLYHDADMVFGARSVEAVIEIQRRLPRYVIGAVYPSSFNRHVIVGHQSEPAMMVEGYEVARADRLGFGFVLIPLSILGVLPKPWMRETWDGHDLVTPDTTFSHRAKEVGYNLCIARIPGVKHHVVTVEGVDDL